jgi:hypothetical protein
MYTQQCEVKMNGSFWEKIGLSLKFKEKIHLFKGTVAQDFRRDFIKRTHLGPFSFPKIFS